MLGVTLGFTPDIPYPHQRIHYKSNYELVLPLIITLIVSCKQSTTTEFIKDISCYPDFSSLNWAELSNKYYPRTLPIGIRNVPADNHDYPKTPISEFWHLFAERTYRLSSKILIFEN